MNTVKTLTLAMFALGSAQVSAIEFEAGPVSAQLNTSVSWGMGIRTEEADPKQTHPANYNAVHGTSFTASGDNRAGSSYNFDDGTLNYKKGDLISNVVKGNVDLELVMGDGGAFFRGLAFYDQVIMGEDPAFSPYIPATEDAAGSGYDLLDAFVWYNFDMGEIPASLRAGRQVVSWGESTFILGGINSINPINASAVRKPGVEVKEVLLPVNMLYGSFGLTDEVTLETFYQLEWEKTRSDACGTFFATVDFVADGCGPVVLAGDQQEQEIVAEYESGAEAAVTPRVNDVLPKDDGQYGLALRWYSEEWGDTEFGLYYMNVHSRLPVIGGFTAGNGENTPQYRLEYPEDIQLVGISFNRATDGGLSLGGEFSYKQDFPVQWNSFEILQGGLLNPYSLLLQDRAQPSIDDGTYANMSEAIAGLAGAEFTGYDFYDIAQIQMTAIMFVDQVLAASRLTLVSEVGLTYVVDLPGLDEARYGRSGAYGIGTIPDATVAGGDACASVFLNDGTTLNTAKNLNTSYCTNEGFTDEVSYGVRFLAALEYPSLLWGMNVKPQVSIGLDEGNAPGPGGAFVDGRIKTGLGVNFDYLNKYSGGLTYTLFDGGTYDPLKDRDNISLNLKVTF